MRNRISRSDLVPGNIVKLFDGKEDYMVCHSEGYYYLLKLDTGELVIRAKTVEELMARFDYTPSATRYKVYDYIIYDPSARKELEPEIEGWEWDQSLEAHLQDSYDALCEELLDEEDLEG